MRFDIAKLQKVFEIPNKMAEKITSLLQKLRAAISDALISLNLQFGSKRVAYPCKHIEPWAVSIILDAAKV